MKGLDTNVIVRFVVERSPHRNQETRFFKKTGFLFLL